MEVLVGHGWRGHRDEGRKAAVARGKIAPNTGKQLRRLQDAPVSPLHKYNYDYLLPVLFLSLPSSCPRGASFFFSLPLSCVCFPSLHASTHVPQIGLHFLSTLILKDRAYHLPSLSQLGLSHSDATLNTNYTPPILPHINDPPIVDSSDRANATFVLLCRNSDLEGAISSIQQMEDRFNRYHGYPWVLLNEEPFTQEFKESAHPFYNGPLCSLLMR